MKRRTLFTAVAMLATAPFTVLAWTGPTGAPPNNNTNGPVWLQTGAVTAQTGKISISGATISAATTTQDIYVTTGKSIRVDGAGSTVFNFGNYGASASAFTLGVYGDLDINGFNNNGLGTLYVNRLCLNNGVTPGTDCQTTWPSGGGGYPGDLFVNTTGDAMTGALTITTSAINQPLVVTMNSAGAGANTGILATVTAVAGGTGVQGNAGATGIGVVGTAQTGGTGVYGSTVTGRGMDARATGAGDALFAYNSSNGLAGRFSSTNGTSIVTTAESTSGIGLLAYNTASGLNAQAIVGIADNCVNGVSNCGARGVSGSAANGIGVYGNAANQRNAGVYGFGFYGVQGAGLTGVRADGTSAFGVEGRGPVAGVAGYGTGGANTMGVLGENTVANAFGVFGRNTAAGGRAIQGESHVANTQAVRGWVNTTGGVGVEGEVGDANGIGVRGYANTGNARAVGVQGQSNSPAGIGVQALADGAMGIGVAATGTRLGGVFEATGYVIDPYVRLATCSQSNCSTETGVYSFGNIGVFGQAATNGIGVRGDAPGTGTGVTGNGGSIGGRFDGTMDVVLAGTGSINAEATPMSFYIAGTENVRFATGGATTKSAGTTWGTAFSDSRLKDVQGSFTGGLDEIMKLNPVYFTWKKGNSEGLESDMKHLGFIAQDVQKVFPEMVAKRESGYLGIDSYDPIMWAMLNSIKELKTENDSLKSQLNDLNTRLEKLENAQ